MGRKEPGSTAGAVKAGRAGPGVFSGTWAWAAFSFPWSVFREAAGSRASSLSQVTDALLLDGGSTRSGLFLNWSPFLMKRLRPQCS